LPETFFISLIWNETLNNTYLLKLYEPPDCASITNPATMKKYSDHDCINVTCFYWKIFIG